MHTIALFGGTFAPIHLGHLYTAKRIQATFHFEKMYFLPCKEPVHKAPPRFSAEERVKLIQLALKDVPIKNAALSLEELNHPGPSYMVDTLRRIRLKATDVSITLIVGMDSFLTIPTWHQSEQILTVCNLLVLKRPGLSLPSNTLVKPHDLLTHTHGLLYFFDAGEFDISSTMIQEKLAKNESVEKMVSKSVANKICKD